MFLHKVSFRLHGFRIRKHVLRYCKYLTYKGLRKLRNQELYDWHITPFFVTCEEMKHDATGEACDRYGREMKTLDG